MEGKWIEFVWRGTEHHTGKVIERSELYASDYIVWSVQEISCGQHPVSCGSHLVLLHGDQIISVLCDDQSFLLEIQYGDYTSAVPVRTR